MGLSPGTRLGPYEIVSPLGAGGMGEVYRARDTRLDRTVAIKVLPEHLSSDPQRSERFQREARTLSALSHPNICALHDVGEQNGIHYLVLEFIAGESLADRLSKGPLPLAEAMRIAAEVASALDVAHRHGLVHRDVKPANVMLTRSGAKLLDFGLAKPAAILAASTSGDTAGPTLSKSLTQDGTLVGTFQYCCPLPCRETACGSQMLPVKTARNQMAPAYSPDRRHITYFSNLKGVENESIWVSNSDGSP